MPALRRSRFKRLALIVLAAITALLAFGALQSGRAARKHDLKFEAWLTAAPCDFPVDLSTPGVWEAPFNQTCSTSHGQAIRLWATDTAGAPIEDPAALDGLEGSLRIIDDAGEIVAESPLPGSPNGIAPPPGAITLATLVPFSTGPCQVQIEVTGGAPALAGAIQRITAAYELCGLERLPAQIARGLAIAMWVAAVVAALITVVLALPRSAVQ